MKYLPVEVQRNLVLSVGTHRGKRPLSPIEAGIAIDQEIRQGTSLAELARDLLLKDTTMLPKFRRLVQLPAEVRHLVDWGGSPATISMSSAAEISRLADSDDQQLLADAVLSNRLTRIEVQQIVELSLKQIASLPAAVQSILNTRPKTVHQHIFVGAVDRSGISESISTMTQQQRDEILANVLKRIVPKEISAKGRLGLSRFDIVGGEDLANHFDKVPQGFEQLINHEIALEVVQ